MPIKSGGKTLSDFICPDIYPIALEVHGKIASSYVIKQYGQDRVICKYYYPYVPHTPAQSAWETYFGQAVAQWQGMGEDTKAVYNARIWPENMSGYNRFIRQYLVTCKGLVL